MQILYVEFYAPCVHEVWHQNEVLTLLTGFSIATRGFKFSSNYPISIHHHLLYPNT